MADTAQIEEIVKQVLASMSGMGSASGGENRTAGGSIPKTAHVAMLTGLEHFDVKEFPMPEVGDGDREDGKECENRQRRQGSEGG